MKKTVFIFLSILSAASLYLSCSKQSDYPRNDAITPSNLSGLDTNHLPLDTSSWVMPEITNPNQVICSTYDPSNLNYNFTFTDGKDTTITLTKRMLYFSDTTNFLSALDLFLGALDSNLDAWEIERAYKSMRRGIFERTSADTIELNKNMSEYLNYGYDYGTSVNEQYCVRIGDSILVDFENRGDVLIIDCNSNTFHVLNYRASTTSDCIIKRNKNHASIYYNKDGTRILDNTTTPYYVYYAVKVAMAGLWTASVYMEDGININLDFDYNGINLAALYDGNLLHMRKDQWHKVCYKIKNSSKPLYCDWDNHQTKPPIGAKVSRWRYDFAKRKKFLVSPYCVPSFERTHNWPIIYNEDIHLDYWF